MEMSLVYKYTYFPLTNAHSFLNQTRKKIKDLSDSHLKMKDAYSEVCLMFAESSKTEPAVFFGYFQNFIKSWKVIFVCVCVHACVLVAPQN